MSTRRPDLESEALAEVVKGEGVRGGDGGQRQGRSVQRHGADAVLAQILGREIFQDREGGGKLFTGEKRKALSSLVTVPRATRASKRFLDDLPRDEAGVEEEPAQWSRRHKRQL